MNNFGDVLRDHGIGLGKYKIGGNIGVSNLNVPHVLFTFGEEASWVRAVDSLGNLYISDGSSSGNNLIKYDSQLNQIWKARIYPTGALNHPSIMRVVMGKDDTPWVQLDFQKTDFKYYIGFFKINKYTGAIEAGIDFQIGQTDSNLWNFTVDQLTADVIYIAEVKRSASTSEIRKTILPSKTVEWTYQLGTTSVYGAPSLIAHANGSLYVAAPTGYLHRINTSSATDYYKRAMPLGSGFAVDTEGNAYTSGYDSRHRIESVSLSGGYRWGYTSSVKTESIAVSRDSKYVYSTSAEGGYVGMDRLEKLDAATGALLKVIRPDGRKYDLVTSPNGDVYMTSSNIGVSTPNCLRETFKILN
ncbi:hypothetical protein [Brevibacillus fortis]|uniref:hypothetical protein n=1 Tax=Brevibacillus fortis TaxID=2126352 RepID=UPI0038FCE646